ncbi:MAG: radical SAM protein [Polyangiales bacterium]
MHPRRLPLLSATTSLDFTLANLRARMPPGFNVGDVIVGDWRLDDVHYDGPDGVRFEIVDGRGGAYSVLVSPRGTGGDATLRASPHFDVSFHFDPRREPPERDRDADRAVARIADAVASTDAPDTPWRFARPAPPLTNVRLSSPFGETDREFNLSVESPCHSRCLFCSIRTEEVRVDLDEGYHQGLLREVARGRALGATVLRLNGIDPLSYPRVVDLLAAGSAAGYSAAVVFTTGLPLADPDLAARVVSAMPPRRRFHLPIYGASPATHDPLVGRPGAFELLLRAIDNLLARVSPDDIEVTTVLMRQNLADLPAVDALLRARGLVLNAHMPYPKDNRDTHAFDACAPSFTDAVATLHAASPPVVVREAPPCVLLRHELATGVPSRSRLNPHQWAPVGRVYEADTYLLSDQRRRVDAAPAIRCPSADDCALAHACTQHVYRAYADLHGLDEFVAVTADELSQAPEVLSPTSM